MDYATVRGIVKTESALNPYAIGVDDRQAYRLSRTPTNPRDAVAAMALLDSLGVKYSVGLGQIHISNIRRHKISTAQIFDPCTNLQWLAKILSDCYARALQRTNIPNQALELALSCYNSNNFSTGFRNGYVSKVRANAYKK